MKFTIRQWVRSPGAPQAAQSMLGSSGAAAAAAAAAAKAAGLQQDQQDGFISTCIMYLLTFIYIYIHV